MAMDKNAKKLLACSARGALIVVKHSPFRPYSDMAEEIAYAYMSSALMMMLGLKLIKDADALVVGEAMSRSAYGYAVKLAAEDGL